MRNCCGFHVYRQHFLVYFFNSIFKILIFIINKNFRCNSYLQRIEVILPNRRLRRSLLWGNNLRPKFLVISPKRWTIYFSNFWKNSTFADICEFNYGPRSLRSTPKILVSGAGNVLALAIDDTLGQLFWSTVSTLNNGEKIGSIYSISLECL